jgi:molybdopterin molybdotransferase
MLTVPEALEIVLRNTAALPAAVMPLHDALGLVLAEDAASDLDMPPFDKAMMDGFAVRSSDLRDGKAELVIVEEIPAGKTPTVEVKAGQASRIMTGAPMPAGADAVVMIERCELVGNRVHVNDARLTVGQNTLAKAREMRAGETVLQAGARLRPQELGLLAAVGRSAVKVQPAPSVAILPTGDELVEPNVKPGPSQIRNSNGPMLAAQAARAGGVPRLLGIARDQPALLRAAITEGLHSDVLILSGGVSAGKLDLVPGVLAELGVTALFHKVAMKPGKPVLFGVRQSGQIVFGLPGNPVSSMVCFELFVRLAIRTLMRLEPGPSYLQAALKKDFPYRTDRPTYHPALLRLTDTGWTVAPTAWFGSPDLRGLLPANAFVLLPEGDHEHRAGSRLTVLRVENDDH